MDKKKENALLELRNMSYNREGQAAITAKAIELGYPELADSVARKAAWHSVILPQKQEPQKQEQKKERKINFNYPGQVIQFRKKLINHINSGNCERLKDYICGAFDSYNPKNSSKHPCLDELQEASQILTNNGWKVFKAEWKEKGLQMIVVNPKNEWYHSNYDHSVETQKQETIQGTQKQEAPKKEIKQEPKKQETIQGTQKQEAPKKEIKPEPKKQETPKKEPKQETRLASFESCKKNVKAALEQRGRVDYAGAIGNIFMYIGKSLGGK